MKILKILCLAVLFAYAKPIVTTSILPTAYFVSQIAADTIQINTMVQKGADPHTYEPKPTQMKMLENSEIYFSVGMEFESIWLDKFKKSFPNLMIVKTDENIKKMQSTHHHEHHDHDEDHEHHDDHDDDEGLDPHIWLDPVLVKTQSQNIAKALISKFPKNREIYEKNLQKFLDKLEELDKFAKQEFANLKNRKFLVYHPSWGYFANRYNLKQISIEVDAKEPKPALLKEIIDEVKEENIDVIFVAPQFSQKAAKTIAKQTGAKIVEIDQLPLKWEYEFKKSVKAIKNSLK